jgi:DNA-binding NarL/FixJ family response regulator
MLAGIGVEVLAERARHELAAMGTTPRKRTADTGGTTATQTRDKLTAPEARIARLAGSGRSNPEIGAELFISSPFRSALRNPSTVSSSNSRLMPVTMASDAPRVLNPI